MRFLYIALAVAVMLLASTNAAPAEQNLISKTTPDLVTRSLATTQEDAPAKRNLRKYADDEDSLDSLDSLNESEERAGGINMKDLLKLANTKHQALPINFAKLNANMQEKLIKMWSKQLMSQKAFASKLGLKSIGDTSHRNYPIFQAFASRFAVTS